MQKPVKRKRRTPEQARQEILDAAEHIILTKGPVELKFQTIAEQAGLAKSNVHHHFGGVLDIKRALTDRLLERLAASLAQALSEEASGDLIEYADSVLARIYDILVRPQISRLIGWVALSTELDVQGDFVQPLPLIVQMIVAKMNPHLELSVAENLARELVYQISVTAIGEGMIGDAIAPVTLARPADGQGASWIRAYWRQQLEAALDQ